MLKFEYGKKYVDYKNNVYTFIHHFGEPDRGVLVFTDRDNRAIYREPNGQLNSVRKNPGDIIAEYVEPPYSWFWITDVTTEVLSYKTLHKHFYRSRKELIDAVPDSLRKNPSFKILKLNLNTGETCLDT